MRRVASFLVLFFLLSAASSLALDCTPSTPVCALNGTTFASACEAHAASALIAYPGSCSQDCASCAAEWRPVCAGPAAKPITYGSPCFAACNNATDYAADEVGVPCAQKAGCSCVQVFDPVCGADNNTYSNEGCAACWEVPVKSSGACPPIEDLPGPGPQPEEQPADEPEEDPCAMACWGDQYQMQDPVCLVRTANRTQNVQELPLTFQNACFAKCQAGAKDGDLHYKGECNSTCDDLCSPFDADGRRKKSSRYSDQVCCPEGVEYPNQCYAECVGGRDANASKLCYRGQCQGARAQALLQASGCAPGSTSAQCFIDPCKDTRCRAAAGAVCIPNYCTKYFRLQYVDALCAPVWMGKRGNLLTPTCPEQPQLMT